MSTRNAGATEGSTADETPRTGRTAKSPVAYKGIITRTLPKGLLAAAVVSVVLAGCGSSSSPNASPSTAPAATTAASPNAATTKVTATAFSPEKGSLQGTSGKGMVVDLAFRSREPAALPGSFRLGGALPEPAPAVKPGHNPAFPGLVVTLSTTAPALGGPTANLANLFQIVTTSTQADGSAEIWATWTNAKPGFGVDVDSQLNAYTVSGDAPDMVPADRSALSVTSNVVTVSFHLAGPVVAPAPTTTAAP